MWSNSHDFVRPKDDAERAYLESLVRDDYDRCHPGETFDEMKRRIPFSKEDRDYTAIGSRLQRRATRRSPPSAHCRSLPNDREGSHQSSAGDRRDIRR